MIIGNSKPNHIGAQGTFDKNSPEGGISEGGPIPHPYTLFLGNHDDALGLREGGRPRVNVSFLISVSMKDHTLYHRFRGCLRTAKRHSSGSCFWATRRRPVRKGSRPCFHINFEFWVTDNCTRHTTLCGLLEDYTMSFFGEFLFLLGNHDDALGLREGGRPRALWD